MDNLQKKYSRPLTFALILHTIILSALFIDLNFQSQPRLASENKNNVNIVKAVAVQQNKVEAEMNRLQKEREEQQAQEAAKQEKLKKQAARAMQQRKEEQAKLHKMQEQLKLAEKQRLAQQKAAEQQLEKIKQQQAAENKRLKEIKEQQTIAAVEEKRKADLAAKQAAIAAKQKADALQRKNDLEREVQEEAQSAVNQSEIDKYKALVINAIQNNWNYPENATEDMTCLLQIKLGPGGVVLSVAIVQSSGNNLLDRSAEVAVYKASPLPVPSDPALFDKFRTLNLKVRPQGKVSV